MSRPSTIDQLPEELRDRIGQLRGDGHTIDEILAALGELSIDKISRSALGRHVKGMEAVGRKLKQSREIALALVRDLGTEPASRTARMNIELLQSTVMDLLMKVADDEELAPKAVLELSKSVQALTNASRQDAEYLKQVEARAVTRAQKDAAKAAEAVVREKGLSADVASDIKARIFGMQPPRAAP